MSLLLHIATTKRGHRFHLTQGRDWTVCGYGVDWFGIDFEVGKIKAMYGDLICANCRRHILGWEAL